ncbi:MAG TPA: hypothetical protein VFZ01_08310 [Geminicoccaceae bacterium]
MQVDLGPRAGRGEPPRPTWTAAGPERAVRPRRSLRHAGRRYLLDEHGFTKIGEPGALRREQAALAPLAGLAGLPRVRSFEICDGDARLTLEPIAGRRLDLVDLSPRRLAAVLAKATRHVLRLARRGVRHNDLRMENWILAPDGGLHLVDFERADRAPPLRCLIDGLLALRRSGDEPRLGLLEIVCSWLRDRMPPALLRRLHRSRPSIPPLEGPADEAALRQAWVLAACSDASSPGAAVAYHRLQVGHLDLPGERDFGARWRAIASAVDWEGRRVLEIGCNLALFSTFALREHGAAAALAVDHDPTILEAAALAAKALGVRPMLARVDLDGPEPWERLLHGFEPDVVVALSVLNWLAAPDRLLRFLTRCPLVLYEGHDSAHRERQRLLAAGFEDVERVLTSERGRALFLCHGSSATAARRARPAHRLT